MIIMKKWRSKTDGRLQEPIQVVENNGTFKIIDGWHRLAISYKLGLTMVPVTVLDRD